MPLDIGLLQSSLESVAANPPATSPECAHAWAEAVRSYAEGIVPPSAAVAGAAATLEGALASAFASPAAAPAMEAAFASFAATVGGGMAGFAPTPPAAPVGFAQLFAGPKPATHAAAASALAALIDTWLRLGIATLVAPPNTPTPWS
ncbi:MAG TPA: hypothetical protein VFQ61_06295 [Polyangiaceae bacterium]|nr:hypothetical protein [Polyangiaceae bacterium]